MLKSLGAAGKEREAMIIDLKTLDVENVYEIFGVEGNEAAALNDSYLDLFEIIGKDAMLKLFRYFRGDKIELPMKLYRLEFVVDLCRTVTDRRERAKIARACGYSVKFVEAQLNKLKNNGECE